MSEELREKITHAICWTFYMMDIDDPRLHPMHKGDIENAVENILSIPEIKAALAAKEE